MRHTLLSIFILLLVTTAYAQTKIVGVVTDTKGNTLVGANIYIDGTYDGVSSNADGSFAFTTNELGKKNLIVDYIGYESFAKPISIGNKVLTIDITLKEEFNELNAVNVSAGAFEAGDKKKSIAITSLDMVTTPSATGDIYGAIQTLPGTSTVGESGKLFVKGGSSRETKTFIDGTLVYSPYSSSAPNMSVRGRFNPFMFGGTMFSTGGYSAEYGQAMSGILVLKTKEKPVEDQLNISVLSVGMDASVTKTFEKSSITASIGHGNLKPYMSLVPQNMQWNSYPKSTNGEISYRLKTAKSGLLKIYSKASQSNFSLLQSNYGESYNYKLKNDNVFVNASWAGELSNNYILTTGFSYTHNADYVSFDTAQYNKYLNGSHAKLMVSKSITKKIKIKAGTDMFYKKYDTEFLYKSDNHNQGFENSSVAGFVETELYASNKFVARLGGRVEYSSYLNRANVSPRVSVAYKFSKVSQVSMAYGWFFQDPADEFLLYTNSLNYERADHYVLNYQFEKNDRVLRNELFYKGYKNLVKFTDNPFYKPEGYNNTGFGEVAGFDFFYRDNKTFRFAEFWVSYSFIAAEKYELDYPVPATPNYTSRHNLTVVYKHWVGKLRSQVGASYKVASPRAYNNPNTPAFNAEHTIAYQTVDINWSFLYRQNIIFYASVSNVLGFKQQFGYSYSKTPDQTGTYASTPILPSAKRFYLIACFITLSRKGDVNQMDKINY